MKDSGARPHRLLMVGFFLSLLGWGAQEVRGASGLTFAACTTNGMPGSQLVVPIKTAGFNNINTFQFSIHWSPSVVSFVDVEQFGISGLAGGNFGQTMINNGTLTVSWDDPSGFSQTVPDGTVMMALRFQLTGTLGQSSSYFIDGNPTMVEVADGDLQVLSVSLVSGQIGISAPNSPPVLTAIANRTINEGSLLSFTASASDSDTPAQTLTFSLDAGAPAGAAINPGTGAFTWTPTEAQGPSTNPITVRVTDNGFGNLSAAQSFTVTVNEVNSTPVIPAIGNKTINESTLLTFALNATDADIPAQTLTYSLALGAPVGASIDPVSGVFSWTPTEAQGPGTYSITFRVTDNGSPALTASQTIIVTVNEVNSAPLLAAIPNKTINEQTLLSFSASASDSDIPAQTLTYSLDPGAPTGASINSVNGLFTWTPTEAQGPGTYVVTIRVTDSGSPPLSASQAVTIVVNEVNTTPVLAAIANRTVNEQTAITFTASATDADLPAQTLTFSLDPGAPAGASIDPASGVFTWTPTEAQGPSTNRITVRVTDNGVPALSATQAVTITVNEVNTAPVLAAIANKTIAEQTLLTFTASAADSDLPAQTLTYSLDAGAPSGASINPSTGVFTWTPTEAQGPATNLITVRVTDNGSPPASAAQTFSVTVNEVNSAPALLPISDKSISQGGLFSFAISATDPDIPSQTLTYSLDPGAPSGTAVDSITGLFSWTPSVAQGGTTNRITARVTDNGSPVLSAAQTFTILVGGPNAVPVMAAVGNKTVLRGSLLTFTVSATDADVPAQTLAFSLDAGAPVGAGIDPATGVFTWTPATLQGPSTNLVTIRVTDSGTPPASSAQTITIVVTAVNTVPALAAIGNRTINELTLLTFTASATDSDVPAQTLTYSLDAGAPAGAAIDPVTGVFTWTPTEAQGPSTSTVTVRVTDSGSPPLSAFQSITITVNEVNSAPVLAAIANKTINENTLLTFNALGTDSDLPAQTLTYSLDFGAPVGASIDPATGVFTWTPTEAQGPSTNTITIRVKDNGSPVLSAFQTITVVVNEVNSPPVLSPIGNKSVAENTLLTFKATAVDPDLPAQTLTFTLDPGAPLGASINPSTGVFTWTPPKSQTTTTNLLTVRVTDSASPPASASETIAVVVTHMNTAPVLAAIGNQTINEQTLLTFTASATDSDLPAQALTYTLDAGAPAGASINPASGVFTWTPTEAQGPSVASITIRVTDNGFPAMSAAQTFTVTVKEVNSAPSLGFLSDQTVNELSLLTFTALATDTDIPVQTLTYTLDLGAPSGASINSTNGVFKWTPTEAQGPGSYPITVRVIDNGVPPLNAAQTFTVTVNEVNLAPILAAIPNKTVSAGNLLTFTASATDADLPAQKLTYSLGANAPLGAAIDPATGVFAWTPPSGLGIITVTVRVTDNGSPAMSASRDVMLTVTDPTITPVLNAIGDKTVNKGTLLTFTVSALNANAFPQGLTYSLGPGAPAGTAIDPASGVFTWLPTQAQGPSTNLVTFRVTDNSPTASAATETISIYVLNSNAPPVLGPVANKTVAEGTPLTFSAAPPFAPQSPHAVTYSLDEGAPSGASIDPVTGQFTWIPTEIQGPSIVTITIRATDNGSPALTTFRTLTITILEGNSAPVLVPISDQTVDEGDLLAVTVFATDPDIPAQRLTYSLVPGAPAGAAIQPTTGFFTWVPTEAQGPGVYHVAVRVADNGLPSMSATQTFAITVNEVNAAPVLAFIPDKTVNEGSLLTFKASATDSDLPAQVLTYSLDPGAPAGASINPTNGVFTWIPSEIQGPNTYQLTIRVTDNGVPALGASQSFSVVVYEVNSPPVLAPISNQTVNERNLLTFVVSATDPDIPVQTLIYSLGAGPIGASIDPASGVFTWTPTEVQGPKVYPVTIHVTDTGNPALGASQTISITVNEVNTPPVLAHIGNKIINEGTLLTFKASATDADVPAQVLTFSLDAGAPTNAAIQAATGVFSWKPTEAQGPSTNFVTVRVTDNGSPAASAAETITITVTEVNSPPVLARIPNKTVNEGNALTFTATATDPDIPVQTLTYSLDAGAPAGATIDPVSGSFSWTPTEAQGPATFTVTVRVTDNGSPVLSSFQNVSIAVREVNSPPVLAHIDDQTVDEGSLLSFSASGTDSDIPAQTLTYSLLPGAPGGAHIDPVTGLFTWVPTEAQGPSTNHLTIRVADNGVPSMSATQAIIVTVNEVNSAPVLARIPDKTINEQTLLTFKVTATDADLPAQILTYTLDPGAPAGAAINPLTGVFTWTPTEVQGPSTYPITVRVTDNGSPILAAFQTFFVTVNEVNVAPVLAPIGNKTVNEGGLLTFTVTATDADIPAQLLTYSLGPGAPVGAAMDPITGIFTWTPTEVQGPRIFPVQIRVTDSGTPALSAAQTISITVYEVNTPPVLAPIGNKTTDEGILLTFKAFATDADIPAQVLTYSLDTNAPAGAHIQPSTGVFTWTPSEAQGPSTNLVTIRVADNGTPAATNSETITIIVNEVNSPPVLAAIANKTVNEQTLLTFTVAATDPDLPANNLTYSLGAGAPDGASIDPVTGVFTWTPTEEQGPSTVTVTVRVTDDGSPPFSAFQNVIITVKEVNTPPVLAPIGDMTVSKGNLLTFAASATDSDIPAQILAYSLGPGGPIGASINPSSGVFTLLPTGTQKPSTNLVTIRVADNGVPSLSATQRFTITIVDSSPAPLALVQPKTVIAPAPSLEALPSTNSLPTLVLHGVPGTHYVLESTSDEGIAKAWKTAWQGTLTNTIQIIQPSGPVTNRLTLFRAVQQ